MNVFFPGFIMSFREGFEAFLIIVLIFKFLEKTGNKNLKWGVISGLILSILLSFIFPNFFLLVFCSYILYIKIKIYIKNVKKE